MSEICAESVAGYGTWFRPVERLEDMLTGLDVLEPGLVPISDWWPDGPRTRPAGPIQQLFLGAMGRKP